MIIKAVRLSVSIPGDLGACLLGEAQRQRRPLSWLVADALRIYLKAGEATQLPGHQSPPADSVNEGGAHGEPRPLPRPAEL